MNTMLLICPICGQSIIIKTSSVHRRKTCSRKCRAIYFSRMMSGENNPNYKNAMVSKICEVCGKIFFYYPSMGKRIYCSKKCQAIKYSETYSGKGNPAYNGGKNYYGINWRSQRNLALRKANGICENCGKGYKILDVHHKKPFKAFEDYRDANVLENLICLCKKCHRKLEYISAKRYRIFPKYKRIISDNMYTPQEVANMLGISIWSIYSHIKRRNITPNNIYSNNELITRPRYELSEKDIEHIRNLHNKKFKNKI